MKKILLTALLCLVAVSVFFACDSGDTDNTDTTQGTTDATTEAPEVKVTASEVDALILAIDGPTVENTAKIDEAYLAYCALSAEEKKEVLYLDLLQALRYNLTKAYVVKEYSDTRVPHNELLIGVYGTGVTSRDLEYIKNANVDFVWSPSVSLDECQKYGLGVFAGLGVTGLPYRFEENLTEDEYRAAIQGITVNNHPNLWAIDCIDEPNASWFHGIGVMGNVVQNELLPDVAYFANLFPNYGSPGQFGVGSYKQYLMAYVARIDTDILCYDHYMYEHGTGINIGEVLEQFDSVIEMCRSKDMDHYAILQVNSANSTKITTGGYTMTEEMLKFQGYTSMAYGAKCIAWACWPMWWWDYNVLNNDRNLTPLYAELQAANADLQALEPVYMRYSSVSAAAHCGTESPQFDTTLQNYARKNKISALKQTSLTDIVIPETDDVIIGHFKKNVGEGEAFMLVGCNSVIFDEEVSSTVTFKTAKADASVVAYDKGIATKLTPDANGVYTVEIHNADAVFVTVE